MRFRKDLAIRCGDLRVRPDVVFTKVKLAVFVDGCFWHGCPKHQQVPKRNPEYWVPKLKGNETRDRRVDAALAAEGWSVIRVWEHEDPDSVAETVSDAWRRLSDALAPSPGIDQC